VNRCLLLGVVAGLIVLPSLRGAPPEPTEKALQQTLDLAIGDAQDVEVSTGKKVRVKLLDVKEERDELRQAVRKAQVKVEVGGDTVTLFAGNYHLPVTVAGVQIDCSVTGGYRRDSTKTVRNDDPWGLVKDARLRVWPAGSPWIKPGTFRYPAKQRWFASGTHMANEPCHVDGGENPLVKQIYYHYGLDIGGAEAMVEVIAATDGIVVSSGKEILPGYEDTPAKTRYDVVYVLDNRGWYYRYSHLHTIGPDVKPGAKVKMGQLIGLLGKEGGSGGWSHLHFDITARQPSGQWGIVEGYAFLWEAYRNEYKPKLIAVARPHHLVAAGQTVTLDGSRSWSASGKIASYAWTFSDGKSAQGATAERVYSKPGVYSEVLKVTDGDGRVDYDFAVVNVLDKEHPDILPPSIHAVYSPTFNIKPGDPVTFLVRTFRTTDGKESWDFGDGTPKVGVQSDGNVVKHAKDGYARTVHKFDKAGHYLVRVERTDKRGYTATARLHVTVGEEPSSAAPSDDSLDVLAANAETPPNRMLRAYLLAEAQKHFDARKATIEKLKTREALTERQRELRAKFIEALGGFPEKTPLNARVVGKQERDGYRIEKIVYESRPSHHVTATLYLPAGKPPFPGVLMPIGHSINGKAADYIQRGCILLAKNGIAALTYDPIGQGERRQLLDERGQPAIKGSTGEHTMVGVGALLVGRSTASYRIWDGIRSLDYLASREEIDPQRLGCTGCSGGGTLTSYLMALDDRIAVAAPSCYVTSLERLFATIGPQDAEQNITGQVAFGMEHADYVNMRAPRPTLILAATRDFFDIRGTWTTFREAKRAYGLMGYGERIDLFESDSSHGFPQNQREACTRWMRRWLLHIDDAPVEQKFAIAKDAALLCTRTGQVLEELKGKSVFHLNAEREAELAAQRAKAREAGNTEALLKDVRRLTGLRPIRVATMTEAGTSKRGDLTIRKLVFATEPGIQVPALLFEKGSHKRGPLAIHVSGAGKNSAAGVNGPIEKLAASGVRVLAVDLRGFGETAPGKAPRDKSGAFGNDFTEAFLALHLNRPLLGQRLYDLLSIAKKFEGETDDLRLIGVGAAGPIVLHAAALEPRFQRISVEDSLLAWSAVVKTPISQDQLTNVVPGVLQAYDLVDLMSAAAPRSLQVIHPLDAAGKPLAKAAADEVLSPARKAYARHKAEDNLSLIGQ
jgi:dienelactone hydrolase